jgi:hypothetical protein
MFDKLGVIQQPEIGRPKLRAPIVPARARPRKNNRARPAAFYAEVTHFDWGCAGNGRAGTPLPAAARTECAPYHGRLKPCHRSPFARGVSDFPFIYVGPRFHEKILPDPEPFATCSNPQSAIRNPQSAIRNPQCICILFAMLFCLPYFEG